MATSALEPARLPRKLAAILSADVAGYTRATSEDEDHTHRALSLHLDLFSDAVGRHHGRVVHYAGDALLAVFDAAADALACALGVQSEFARRNDALTPTSRIEFRIGLNLGDVIEDRGDVYGTGVNVAARLSALAAPGGTCISESIRMAVGSKLPCGFEALGEKELKNIPERVRVYRVLLSKRLEGGRRAWARYAAAAVLVLAGAVLSINYLLVELPPWVNALGAVFLILSLSLHLVLGWRRSVLAQPESAQAVLAKQAPAAEAPAAGASPNHPRASARFGSNDPSQTLSGPTSADARRQPLPNSVAVLPLENLSPNPHDAYFAAGIHEEILNYLTKIKNLNVIARTSVKRYTNSDKSISEIAQELGVTTVMEGSVRYAGDRVRVTAQLIDGATEKHIWAEVYERSLADVFSIQADIAAKIAGSLEAEFSAAEKKSIEALPTTASSAAHALFLKAQALFGQDDTAIAVTASPDVRAEIRSHLDRALQLDSGFAHLYAIKALVLSVARIYDPIDDKQWLTRCAELDDSVRLNAERALSLNANIGTPHFALALNHQFNWRRAEAHEAYDRALLLKPNDSNILGWYSMFRWFSGDFENAIRLGENAVALDPANSYPLSFLAMAFHAAGDYRRAIDAYDRASVLRPGSPLPYLHRAMPHIAIGNEAAALEGLKLADQLVPEAAPPQLHMHLAYGFSRLGHGEDAKRIVDRVRGKTAGKFIDPIIWVWGHLALGEPARALRLLRQALENPQHRQEIFVRTFVKQNAWSDPVLEEPGFAAARDELAF